MKKLMLIGVALTITATLNAQSLLTSPPLDPAQARVIRAQENAQALRGAVIGGLRHSVDDLWSTDYAANVATAQALGPKAAEFFALFAGFATATRTILVQAGDTAGVAEIDAIVARVPARTVHGNGTVTITPPEEPTP